MAIQVETGTFSKENTSFPFVSANESSSGEAFGSVNLPSSSPKRNAWYSLIKDDGLDRVAKLTHRKKKLYDQFGPDSALYELRNTYVTKK